MPRLQTALSFSLRAAATLTLAAALCPALGRAEDSECADSAIAKRYVEIETTLGTIGLCLIQDDREGFPGNPDVTDISEAFLQAAREGAFEDSFFHRTNTCPDLISCSAELHGGSFRLSEGTFSPTPRDAWSAGDDTVSGYSNDEGTISVARNPDGSLTGDWFINLQDNGWKRDWPQDAYEVFGLVVSGMEVVSVIAALPTVEPARPPSRLHVRYAESACLSGEASPGTPEAALEDCPCPDGAGAVSCIPAEDYPDTLEEPDLWVRIEPYAAPCISGDNAETDPCDCSGGLCVEAETYLGTLHDHALSVRTDATPEPCIRGDESVAVETCECIDAEPNCVPFESYVSGFDSQLYVRIPTPDCISGDDDTESCDCPEEDRGPSGPCVPFDDYVQSSGDDLKVSLAHSVCLSGDAPTGVTDSCVCRAIDLDPGIGRCARADDYAAGYPDLMVREYGSEEPCLSGDDDEDNDDDDPQCLCPEDPYCSQAICSEADIQAGTCGAPEDGYFHGEHDGEYFHQQVWPGRDACISGDQTPESCVCAADDCVTAKSYLETVFVRQAPDETPCISGDDEGDNDADDPQCPCSEADIEDEICVSRDEYLADPSHAGVQVRLGDPACLSGDQTPESCVCGADDCVPVADYFDSEALPPRRWVNTDDDCIHGDDAALDERCSCTDADKAAGTCVLGVDYLEALELLGYVDVSVRLPVPPCIGTDHIDGDESCLCQGADPACQDAAEYLQDVLDPEGELGDEEEDWLIPVIYSGPDPILNVNSSTLVMIPEPRAQVLAAAALATLSLLARCRPERHTRR